MSCIYLAFPNTNWCVWFQFCHCWCLVAVQMTSFCCPSVFILWSLLPFLRSTIIESCIPWGYWLIFPPLTITPWSLFMSAVAQRFLKNVQVFQIWHLVCSSLKILILLYCMLSAWKMDNAFFFLPFPCWFACAVGWFLFSAVTVLISPVCALCCSFKSSSLCNIDCSPLTVSQQRINP